MKTIIIIIADDMLKHVSEPGCILCSVNQSSEHPASLTLPPVIVILISKFISIKSRQFECEGQLTLQEQAHY